MNWTIRRTTEPAVLPVTLKDMLGFAGISATVSTTLSSSAAASDETVTVSDATGLAVGQTIVIGDEHGVISGISSNDVTFAPALPNDVASGSVVSHGAENAALLSSLQASVSQIEDYLNRALITQTITYQSDCFPNQLGGFSMLSASRRAPATISLPRPRLQSITSVKYYQTNNVLATFDASSYFADTLSDPGRIVLNEGYTWPDNVRSAAAVEIIYVAGYGSARASVPVAIREAIKLQTQKAYEADTQGVTSEKVGGVSFSYASSNGDSSGSLLADSAIDLLHPYRLINV